jgi:hypothetical protein
MMPKPRLTGPPTRCRWTMRPQARPFSVEIKNRKRTAPPAPASAARQDDWIDAIPPDDVPERDVHADLADPAGQSEARRKAEWVFARLNGHAEPSETQNEAAPEEPTAPAPEAPAPRVLPDLLAGAREEERTMVEKPKRTRVPKPTKVKRSKKTKSPGPRLEQPEPAASEPANVPVPIGDAQATMSQSRRANQRASKLPPGQRWKERRLPRVCWDR